MTLIISFLNILVSLFNARENTMSNHQLFTLNDELGLFVLK